MLYRAKLVEGVPLNLTLFRIISSERVCNFQTVASTCTWSRVLVAAWRPDLRGAKGMLADIRPDSGVTTTDTCKTLFIRSEIEFVAVFLLLHI